MILIILFLSVLVFYLPLVSFLAYRTSSLLSYFALGIFIFSSSWIINDLLSININFFLCVVSVLVIYSMLKADLPYDIDESKLTIKFNFRDIVSKFFEFVALKFVVTIVVSILLTIITSLFNIGIKSQAVVNEMNGTNDIMTIITLIISVCILAPIAEEYVFRYFFYGYILKTKFKLNIYTSAIISSFVFAIMHDSLGGIVNAFICGLVFAWIYEKHGLWYSIFAHFTFNLIACCMIFI